MMTPLSYKVYTPQNKPTDFTSTLTGAGICIIVNNEVLLLQRSLTHRIQPGTWGIPAGKVESGESTQQAAMRETLEEVGIDLSSERVDYRGDLYVGVEYASPLNISFSVYTVYLPQQPKVILEEGQVAFRWATLEQALQLPLFTGSREVLLLGMQ